MDIQNNTILRYGFLKLMRTEFHLYIREDDIERVLLAQKCIHIYETPEEFLQKSGWRNDNPECSEFSYLERNRICRKIQGKIWYFSRIQYEEEEKKLDPEKRHNCDTNET